MKKIVLNLIVGFVLISLASCSFWMKTINKNSSSDRCDSKSCFIYEAIDSSNVSWCKKQYLDYFQIKKGDTIASIGVGSGWREFVFSVFTDSLTFYMEDVDTSCITKEKINNEYLPHYSKMKGRSISNKFIPTSGTYTTIGIDDNKVDKVLIINVYHHFGDDIAMVKECNRILKSNGKLMIGEFVFRKNKHSYKHCGDGGNYKSEMNFVKDIVDCGFKCDTVVRSRTYRVFVFTKK